MLTKQILSICNDTSSTWCHDETVEQQPIPMSIVNDTHVFYQVPGSWGKFSEMKIWTSQIFTPADLVLKYIRWQFGAWLSFICGMIDKKCACYAGIGFGWTSFWVKLIPQANLTKPPNRNWEGGGLNKMLKYIETSK